MNAESASYALELKDVSLRYPNGFEALHGVNLHVDPGQIIALVGASGSGKSTVLRAVAGLERISAGDIWIGGRNMEGVPTHKRGVGMVFQDGQLFPHMSVYRNIAYGLSMHGWKKAQKKHRVAQLLQLVDLEGFENRSIDTLSGGQAQRVALARSLAPEPQLLLLDEPLSAVDADLRESLSTQLRAILKQTGTSALYVTHDPAEAQRVSDRLVRMNNGQIKP